jgi:hypothetical protein
VSCAYWPAYRLADAALERAGRSDARNYAAKASQEQLDADKLRQQAEQQQQQQQQQQHDDQQNSKQA